MHGQNHIKNGYEVYPKYNNVRTTIVAVDKQ